MNPQYFILFAFLLCSAMSFITGTSFGTVGTMGIVCMTIAKSLDINTVIVGGAIISGLYFGDRCSPNVVNLAIRDLKKKP
nr:Na+/H+ antiporter NhaC family protein [Clostridium sp. DSM 8431]